MVDLFPRYATHPAAPPIVRDPRRYLCKRCLARRLLFPSVTTHPPNAREQLLTLVVAIIESGAQGFDPSGIPGTPGTRTRGLSASYRGRITRTAFPMPKPFRRTVGVGCAASVIVVANPSGIGLAPHASMMAIDGSDLLRVPVSVAA